MIAEPSFSMGVEEEYMLVDRETRELINEVPDSLLDECEKLLGERVAPEFLQCQIEIGTPICHTLSEVRDSISELRGTVASVADKYGLALLAVSTHPFAIEGRQSTTRRERYTRLEQNLQQVVRRLMISGMHVHIGIEDNNLRIDLMGQITYVLPHFLALSTSSPFWHSTNSGLKSYRMSVWDEMPRTGLPEIFDSYAEYRRHVDVLVNANIIDDASMLWWDIRPSERFQTLEMRIADVCTRMEDALCIVAFYRCWLRMLYRLRTDNQRWRRYRNVLLQENRWRAQRYGIDEGLIDFGRGQIVDWRELVEEMLELIFDDAEHFDCVAEVQRARQIIAQGTSAHRQIQVYEHAVASGDDNRTALDKVVDHLISETLEGVS